MRQPAGNRVWSGMRRVSTARHWCALARRAGIGQLWCLSAARDVMVRYAILGPVELRDGERGVAVSGSRQLALLALLLANANRALSNDRLIDELWDGTVRRAPSSVCRSRLAGYAGRWPSQVCGESRRCGRVAGGYLLAVGPGELDAEVFGLRVEEGRRALQAGEVARAHEVLGEALRLWRGPVAGRGGL